ncbi:MAG: N-acetylglucosamine kinase [Chloroflexota bacterium]
MAERRLIAAIDGGGTKTTCLVADTEGTILGRGDGGPANSRVSPPDLVTRSLVGALTAACSAAGCGSEPRDALLRVCVAAASPPDLVAAALASVMPAERVTVVHEATMALLGALGGSIGCVVLAGTGSFARARGPGGIECHVGGWGVLLGDEGSAYDIGRLALVAVARAADGRGPSTALSDIILEHWGLADPYELKRAVYSGDMTQARIAALAPLVTRAAGRGDHVATAILSNAGRALAVAAATAIRGAGLADGPVTVSTAGGVWRAGDLVTRPFSDELRRMVPEATVTKPLFEPVVGGLLYALNECGVAWTPALFDRLRASQLA